MLVTRSVRVDIINPFDLIGFNVLPHHRVSVHKEPDEDTRADQRQTEPNACDSTRQKNHDDNHHYDGSVRLTFMEREPGSLSIPLKCSGSLVKLYVCQHWPSSVENLTTKGGKEPLNHKQPSRVQDGIVMGPLRANIHE
ncbi:hypothetical protein INR49_031036 [Caranx melampygus]|nr:hypothetical protein INR49_031036 [Caranx melampygus]